MGAKAVQQVASAGFDIFNSFEQDAAGRDSARAARGAQDEARQDQINQRRETMGIAANTDFEISRMEESLGVAKRDLARREEILASADPALLEAGKQALQLLRGDKEAGSLSVIRKQREQQRVKLVDQLRQRLGPGAEESSAGIQALTAFDDATAASLQGAQSQETQNLLGLAERNAQNFGTGQSFQQLMSLQNAQRGIQKDRLTASLNTGINQGSGSYVQDYMNAGTRAKTGSNIAGLGNKMFGGGDSGGGDGFSFSGLFGGGGSGKNPFSLMS